MSLHDKLVPGSTSDTLAMLATLSAQAGRFYSEQALTVDDYTIQRLLKRWASCYLHHCPIRSSAGGDEPVFENQSALLVCNNYHHAQQSWQQLQPAQQLKALVQLEQQTLSMVKVLFKQDLNGLAQGAIATWLADLQLLLEDSQTLAERHQPH